MAVRLQFASDTATGVCPEVWSALVRADASGAVPSYGEDNLTAAVEELMSRIFGRPCAAFLVTSTTAANGFALSLLTPPWGGVLCHEAAHLAHDEVTAPEFFTGGAKLVSIGGDRAKIDAGQLPKRLSAGHGYHSPQIAALSLTQATEMGTVYSLDEHRDILRQCEAKEIRIHMDGARLANAVVALALPAATLTEGVDVLTFGGSKNGGFPAEAIVCFAPSLLGESKRHEIKSRLKRAGLLVAKHRYLAGAWLGLLENGVWLRNARQANEQARKLARGFEQLGYTLALPAETNQVFVQLPAETAARLNERGWRFFFFDTVGAYRFVTSWNTTDQDVATLLGDLPVP